MSELCGCVFASSGGGLKSTGSSLLELSPRSSPRSFTFTVSERGGVRSGFLVDPCCEPLSGLDACEFEFEFWADASVPPSNKTTHQLRIPSILMSSVRRAKCLQASLRRFQLGISASLLLYQVILGPAGALGSL